MFATSTNNSKVLLEIRSFITVDPKEKSDLEQMS